MKIDEYLSGKIKFISYTSMILVVFIHAQNFSLRNIVDLNIKKQTHLIQLIFSDGLARVAVPMFFAISGYLFFESKLEFTYNEYVQKLKKRLKTLMLPFFIWSLWSFLFLIILQNLPYSGAFFNNKFDFNISFIEILKSLILHPVATQLWFIRELFLFILFSPIIFICLKYGRFLTFIIIIAFWFADYYIPYFQFESLLFFVLGSNFKIYQTDVNIKISNKILLFFSIFWFILIFFKSYINCFQVNTVFELSFYNKLSILIGFFIYWFIFEKLYNLNFNENLKNIFYKFSQFSFFLYASHEPFLTIIKKILVNVIGQSDVALTFSYFISIVLIIISMYYLAKFFKFNFPNFYRIICGGR